MSAFNIFEWSNKKLWKLLMSIKRFVVDIKDLLLVILGVGGFILAIYLFASWLRVTVKTSSGLLFGFAFFVIWVGIVLYIEIKDLKKQIHYLETQIYKIKKKVVIDDEE